MPSFVGHMLKYRLIFLVIFLKTLHQRAQSFDSVCIQQQLVVNTLRAHHFSPPEFNANTNIEVLELFLREADERNIFFLSADRDFLVNLVRNISSDEVYCGLIVHSYTIMKKRLRQIDSIIYDLESKPLAFYSQDSITFIAGHSERLYAHDPGDLARRIEKRLRYESLVEMTTPKKDSFDLFSLRDDELNTMKGSAKKKSIRRLRHFLEDYRNDIYLVHHLADGMSNALAARCDPHTNYFNFFQLENYRSSLSTDELSFGFSASEDEHGNIIISGLLPGGPAWKSNALNEKDVILSFRFDGEKEVTVDNTGLDEFYSLFSRSSSRVVDLKVRKKDYKIRTVRLKKEKIQSQENVLNSYLLEKKGARYGYIPIPSFYLSQESDSRQGCANDVAKEIIELKQDSIAGLILDLRYNGGGSMREAMALAGIFIDEGPVAIYRPASSKPFVLKDLNRGSIWDGPLVILVNSASASASEFVTATLQDYNRAVIVGSTTFGKGTAQNLMLADSSFYNSKKAAEDESPFGYMKITTGKFYRLTSESHQAKGIVPDVELPGIIEKVMEKESAFPFHLTSDSVNKDVVYHKLKPLPMAELRIRSRERLALSDQFRLITRVGDSLALARRSNEKVALTVKDFKKYSDRQRYFNMRLDDLFSYTGDELRVKNNSQNEKVIAMSDYQRKNNELAIETLKKDLLLHETVNVLSDLGELQRKQ